MIQVGIGYNVIFRMILRSLKQPLLKKLMTALRVRGTCTIVQGGKMIVHGGLHPLPVIVLRTPQILIWTCWYFITPKNGTRNSPICIVQQGTSWTSRYSLWCLTNPTGWPDSHASFSAPIEITDEIKSIRVWSLHMTVFKWARLYHYARNVGYLILASPKSF